MLVLEIKSRLTARVKMIVMLVDVSAIFHEFSVNGKDPMRETEEIFTENVYPQQELGRMLSPLFAMLPMAIMPARESR